MNSLESSLEKVSSDLDFVANKLNDQYLSSDKSAPNVPSLVIRLQAVEAKLQVVKQKSELLAEQRQDLVECAEVLMSSANSLSDGITDGSISSVGVRSQTHFDVCDARQELKATLQATPYYAAASK